MSSKRETYEYQEPAAVRSTWQCARGHGWTGTEGLDGPPTVSFVVGGVEVIHDGCAYCLAELLRANLAIIRRVCVDEG